MTTTDWINDIELSYKLGRDLAERMSEAVEDILSDLVMQFIAQYMPNTDEEELDSDEFLDRVHNPLYDRLLKQVVDHLLPS